MSFTFFDEPRAGGVGLKLPQLREPCTCSATELNCPACVAYGGALRRRYGKRRTSRLLVQVCHSDGRLFFTSIPIMMIKDVHDQRAAGRFSVQIAESLGISRAKVKMIARMRVINEGANVTTE